MLATPRPHTRASCRPQNGSLRQPPNRLIRRHACPERRTARPRRRMRIPFVPPIDPPVEGRNDHLSSLEAEWQQVLAAISDCIWAPTSTTRAAGLIATSRRSSRRSPAGRRSFFSPAWTIGSASSTQTIGEPPMSALRGLIAGKDAAVYEYRIPRTDGSVRWVRSSVRPIRSRGAGGLRLVSDITDQKSAETLRRSEACSPAPWSRTVPTSSP